MKLIKKHILKSMCIIFVLTMLILLYMSSLYNYLLFHTIAEIFSISIVFTVFLITWSSRRYIRNNYLILIGIAYLFIGFIDLFHTLSYKGMQIFKDYDYYANQLWIAARYFESIILLLAFITVKSKKKVNAYVLFSVFTVITTLIMLSIFMWKIFPVCFVDGVGLTSFKKNSEYIISLILLAAMISLTKNKLAFEGKIYQYLLISMACTIISEFAFSIYIDNYGFSNLVGHYFKIFSFYFVYKTIIANGIQEPYDIIFREMKKTEQKLFEQNVNLTSLATLDGLTGLYNNRHLHERLEEETKRYERYKGSFVVMILDIDHFKKVNDTYGHLAGDKILKEVSQILKMNTRETDIVGRYGGEEFLIILPETTLNEGFMIAEKTRRAVELNRFSDQIYITVSIGIEEYSGGKVSELLEKADLKLYAAKNAGRNITIM